MYTEQTEENRNEKRVAFFY